MKQTLAILALTIATASAHPGHPGHEDWPFDDFSWSMAIVAAVSLMCGLVLFNQWSHRRRVNRLHR